MKREILFRGIRTDGGGWVEGDLVQDSDIFLDDEPCFIYYETAIINSKIYEVIPETVGQYIASNDLVRRPFVGDKIRAFTRNDSLKAKPLEMVLNYYNGCFMVSTYTWHEFYKHFQSDYEIIGTIHDHFFVVDNP
jgi:hypothetical protein